MAVVVTVTVESSGGDYTTLSGAESGQQAIRANLVASDEQLDIVCGDLADTTAVTVDGFTCDATRFIRIKAATGDEAEMPWSTSSYRLSVASAPLTLSDTFIRVERIQIETTDTGSNRTVVFSATADIKLIKCHIRTTGTLQHQGVDVRAGGTIVENCFIIGTATASTEGIDDSGGGGGITLRWYNNTVINFAVNYRLDGLPTTVMKNCLGSGSSGNDFTGTGTSNNNASEDTTAPGTDSRVSQTFTFVGASDWHLGAADAGARTYGADLSGDAGWAFSDDFDGVTRVAPWDIGADQVAVVGIAYDAASNSGEQLADDSYTWNHTCTGSNRYLVVGIGMLSLAQTVSSITYNSVAMSFLGAQSSVSGAARVELWGLIAPSTGSNAILVTLTGAINSGGVASSYTGVHQSSPTEAFNSAQATNVGAADATVAVTTVADNDWVVDVVASDDTAITVGTGQTSRNNIAGTVGAVANSDEGPKTPAGAVTMSWTNVGAAATWSIGGIALRPTTASSLNFIPGNTTKFLMLLGLGT